MSYIEYVTADHQSENPLDELARTNGFTMADLEENRGGRISPAQARRLWRRALRPIHYPGGALIGWLGLCFVVNTLVPSIILWIAAMIGGKSITAVFGVVTLTCVGALLVAGLKSARSLSLLMGDLKAGKTACLQGRVSRSHEEEKGLGLARLYGDKHTNHWYVINNEYFDVDEEAFAALPAGGQYRLYYTPQSKLLLSIEPK